MYKPVYILQARGSCLCKQLRSVICKLKSNCEIVAEKFVCV